jgi:hypothetical protein
MMEVPAELPRVASQLPVRCSLMPKNNPNPKDSLPCFRSYLEERHRNSDKLRKGLLYTLWVRRLLYVVCSCLPPLRLNGPL